VLRYLRGTVGYGLIYASGVDMRLQGYDNADWAGSAVDRKSTSGCFLLWDFPWFPSAAGNRLMWF
jgi:hypothetical protein